ncbi:hypothetical protein MMC11_009071, partial [Xylographa trunciseda]|nr:hypothetical protein [Xylographa trunciseda]
MSPLIVRFIAASCFFTLGLAVPLQTQSSSIATNSQTSYTFLFQNNLNATDDYNHVGAILLDSMSQNASGPACAAIGEALISMSTLQTHKLDFLPQLSYNAYAGRALSTQLYYIQGGVVNVTENVALTFQAAPPGGAPLPVLCTQSSNQDNVYSAAPSATNQISVPAGGNTYTGYRNQKSFRYLGIPYADQPARFTYSTLYTPQGQSINATEYGSECAQSGAGSENCLFLNIQTPYIPKAGSTTNLRPVMFWIHGGGFIGGTGADPGSDGGNLASREDIVVVVGIMI